MAYAGRRPAQYYGLSLRFIHEDRCTMVGYQGYAFALTIIIISQFIYGNIHPTIGATLTCIAIGVILCQLVFSALEASYRHANDYATFETVLFFHNWFNQLFLFVCLPFLLWTAVRMFGHST